MYKISRIHKPLSEPRLVQLRPRIRTHAQLSEARVPRRCGSARLYRPGVPSLLGEDAATEFALARMRSGATTPSFFRTCETAFRCAALLLLRILSLSDTYGRQEWRLAGKGKSPDCNIWSHWRLGDRQFPTLHASKNVFL